MRSALDPADAPSALCPPPWRAAARSTSIHLPDEPRRPLGRPALVARRAARLRAARLLAGGLTAAAVAIAPLAGAMFADDVAPLLSQHSSDAVDTDGTDAADGADASGIAAAGGAPMPSAALHTAEVAPDVGTARVEWPEGVRAAAFDVDGVEGAAGTTGDAGALPMASIAKLVFALVLLEERPLAQGEQGPAITLDDDDLRHLADGRRERASVLPVQAGDVLSQRQLLEAAMLMSASNATMTLADWAFGSHDGYLAAAERWLDARGLDGIEVADASGLSARGVATAADLLEVMDAVDDEPTLLEVTGMEATTLPRVGRVENSNEALGAAGIDSGKTGSLIAHGRTVLAGATRTIDGTSVRIHVALLGIAPGVDRGAATAALVDSIATNLQRLPVLSSGAVVGWYDLPWSEPIALETMTAVRLLHWRGTPVRIAVDAPAAWSAGVAASLDVQVGDTSRSLPLELTGAEATPNLG